MIGSFTRAVAALLVSAIVWSGPAMACAVCFQSTEENRWAFIGTTAFLTLFPLFMLGGLFVWLRQRYLAAEAASQQPGLRVLEGGVAAEGEPSPS